MLGFSVSEFCGATGQILQFVGYILTLVKVAIPVLIVVFGMIDLGKAVVASKDDEIKTGAKRLLWRAVAGVFIFFIPSLVMWLFGTIADYNSVQGQFENCRACILTPWAGCNTSGN